MPHLFQSKDRSGKPHPRWRYQFTDWQGRRRTATGTTSKVDTERLARHVQDEQDLIRTGVLPRPAAADRHTAFSKVVAEHVAWGSSQGGWRGRPWGRTHHRMRASHLEWWADRVGLAILGDLEDALPRVEAVLRELKVQGLSGRTVNSYGEALHALCHWCVKGRYLVVNPLAALRRFSETDQPEHRRRRALSPDEVRRVLGVAPPHRRLLYEVALCTGLRANELRNLTVGDVNPELGGLRLDAAWTKNRRGGLQPLPAQVMARLREAAVGKDPHAPLLYAPSHPARALGRDLKVAGIPKSGPQGTIDFHSLRTTFITRLIEAGANPKEVQDLARHQSVQMTLGVYAKVRPERRHQMAERIGQAVLPNTIRAQRKAVGAGGMIVSELAAEGYTDSEVVGAAGFEPATSSPPC